jgi:hypothetical protein
MWVTDDCCLCYRTTRHSTDFESFVSLTRFFTHNYANLNKS